MHIYHLHQDFKCSLLLLDKILLEEHFIDGHVFESTSLDKVLIKEMHDWFHITVHTKVEQLSNLNIGLVSYNVV